MEKMSELEFDLLDELYFVQSYKEIKSALDWQDDVLQQQLFQLYQKEYIKILSEHDVEYDIAQKNSEEIPWQSLYFLASKKGLMEHNGF